MTVDFNGVESAVVRANGIPQGLKAIYIGSREVWHEDYYVVEIENRYYLWIVDTVKKEFRTAEIEEDTVMWLLSFAEGKEFAECRAEEDPVMWMLGFVEPRRFGGVELEENEALWKVLTAAGKKFAGVEMQQNPALWTLRARR